jgi:DNA-binding HxlR family transcriptional regulator
VSDKWKIVIVMTLVSEGAPVRFARLQRLLGHVSRKVLTAALRGLEADGLVTRTVYPEVPPRVEYAVTEAGLGLVPIVRQLDEWWRERERLAAHPPRPKLVALP